MDLQWRDGDSEARFSAYVEQLSGCLGHADRVAPLRSYCTGLLLPGDRKSVEPMAARLRPDRTSAEHQSLLHFVGQSSWDEKALLQAVRAAVLPVMTQRQPIEAWIVDDTGFPKKGHHSVGVGRQYCGQLGKQDNCQVAVSLSVASCEASLPVAWQLYLPEAWAADGARRKKAKVPEGIGFQTKPEIALGQIKAALAEGIAPGVVLADAGYGNSSAFRDGLGALDLEFVVGVSGTATVWRQGITPAVPTATGRGRPPKRLRRGGDDAPVEQVAALAESFPAEAWQAVSWREGAAEALVSRFAALRVRPAQGDHRRSTPRPEHWLLAEWPVDEAEPSKFWLSNLPADTSIDRLVWLAKLRWLIERDYLELKQELGLGHYEGRGWPGFHHHGALCIAAYGFLVAEKAAIPPSTPETTWLVKAPGLPGGYRPRGSPNPNRATCAPLDRHTATTDRTRPGAKPAPMSLLRADHQTSIQCSKQFMTQ
ncbi:MAG: IS701 family transposase [Rhodospirillales bacterium]|nr:IS701 family transposase [Rhodospirillales bacterium]